MTMRVQALVPAFNEARTIAKVVSGLFPHVAAVCVVDDGSTDGTADAARRAGADVVMNPGDRGKGTAIRSGLDIETEMLVKLKRRGGVIASVPITAVYTGQRSKLRPVRDTTKTCFLAVYYRFLERL